MQEQVLIDNGPQVTLGVVVVRVKKPKLRDYKRFIELVAEMRLSIDIQSLFSGEQEASRRAFEALAQTPDKIAELCALASDATADQALDADPEQVLELLVACIKHANVVQAISDAVKKVWGAGPTPPTQTQRD